MSEDEPIDDEVLRERPPTSQQKATCPHGEGLPGRSWAARRTGNQLRVSASPRLSLAAFADGPAEADAATAVTVPARPDDVRGSA